jgi:hypothetical protein
MVLEDVTEMYVHRCAFSIRHMDHADEFHSDPAEGNVKLPKILLNGNNICMVLINLHESNGFVNQSADGSWRRWPDSP